MGKALIIGCGGVASVAIHRVLAQNSDGIQVIMIASRTKSKYGSAQEKLRRHDGAKRSPLAQVVPTMSVCSHRSDPRLQAGRLHQTSRCRTGAHASLNRSRRDELHRRPTLRAGLRQVQYSGSAEYTATLRENPASRRSSLRFSRASRGILPAYALKHHFDRIQLHQHPRLQRQRPAAVKRTSTEINIREVSASSSCRRTASGSWEQAGGIHGRRLTPRSRHRTPYLLLRGSGLSLTIQASSASFFRDVGELPQSPPAASGI